MRTRTPRRGPRCLYKPPLHNERTTTTSNHNKENGHVRTTDPDPPIYPSAISKIKIATTPTQSLPITIDPSQLITSTYASDVSRLQHVTLLINPVSRSHPRTSQRLSHHGIVNNKINNELQRHNTSTSNKFARDGSSGRKKRKSLMPTQLYTP